MGDETKEVFILSCVIIALYRVIGLGYQHVTVDLTFQTVYGCH